jgi:transcriptional regulator with XRE-family HTH domain
MEEADTLQARFGVVARQRRSALGFSQDTFADSIEMHRSYYSAIERGERNLTLFTIARVADELGVKVSTLMREADI